MVFRRDPQEEASVGPSGETGVWSFVFIGIESRASVSGGIHLEACERITWKRYEV